VNAAREDRMRPSHRHPTRPPAAALLAALLAALPATAPGAERLLFQVTRDIEPPPASATAPAPAPAPARPAAPTHESFPLAVVLGEHTLSIEQRGHRTVYDFARRRLYVIDLERGRYTDDSLFSDVGFRVVELNNRLGIGKALAAGGITAANPMLPVPMQHLFGIAFGDEDPGIRATHAKGERVFRWREQELMAVSDAVAPLPAAEQRAYWRFLRYYAGGHPAIYRALGEVAGVPRTVRLRIANAGLETRTLELGSVAATEEPGDPTAGFARTVREAEPFATLAAIAPRAAGEAEAHTRALLAARDAATAAHAYLNAMLLNFEVLFETGPDGVEWLRANHEALGADADTRRFTAAIRPHEPREAAAAVQELLALRAADPERRYLLDVFAGNALTRAGRRDEARERLLAALHRNPRLVGPWFDLGANYLDGFDAPAAWACWDGARALEPAHPFRRSADDLERRLLTDFPDFF
jgi:tetratricopeptide (TPR) repeat protein